MSWLLDVNMILAVRWTTHADHSAARTWLDSADEFFACAITELGFLRISLSAAYRASWEQTREALKKLHTRSSHCFLADDIDGTASPATISKDTADAHLVVLAKRHGLKLATLDVPLTRQPWATGIAEHPILPH